ncbi:hypothetical protein DDK22_17545 [Cupriavidus necator]|uniref:Uncharacterized protein n=1 Tax=Cupriavidus necator TaxID=106590 RepID=A0A367PJK6_CUPNE|nr:hypothetical protein DDK22_17545 [Cupriavidus necator]
MPSPITSKPTLITFVDHYTRSILGCAVVNADMHVNEVFDAIRQLPPLPSGEMEVDVATLDIVVLKTTELHGNQVT